MMSYWSQIYEDELVYSLLARMYVRSGYTSYRYMAEDILASATARIDFEFINHYTASTLSLLTREMSFAELIDKHTMFNYYARFMRTETRREAHTALLNMECKRFYQNISMNKNRQGEIRFLRYCALCAQEDRARYGEAYFHRSHQMRQVKICAKHFCKLIDTDIQITSTKGSILKTAEDCIGSRTSIEYCENEKERKFISYVNEVFQHSLNVSDDVDIGEFLNSRLIGTQYLSRRGEKRYMEMLCNDYNAFYTDMDISGFSARWHVDKIFTSERSNTFGVCLMAFFLGVSAGDLVKMEIASGEKQSDIYDREIHRLHAQGFNYAQIARRMNASYDVVKSIGEGRYGKYHYCKESRQKSGAKKKDWDTLDARMLSKVKMLIDEMEGDGSTRPCRVSVGRVERLLGLKERQLMHLTQCMNYMLSHIVTVEEHWMITLVWAVRELKRDGETVNRTGILRLTNLRVKNIMSALNYLDTVDDRACADVLSALFLDSMTTDA